MGFLADKKILITGMLSTRSIAYGVARVLPARRRNTRLHVTSTMSSWDRVVKIAAEFGTAPVLRCDVVKRTTTSTRRSWR